MKRRLPLQVHISTLFLILILLLGGAIGWLAYSISRNILESTADELTGRIHRETLGNFAALLDPAGAATRLLSRDAVCEEVTEAGRLAQLPFMRELLAASDAMTSLYVAYPDGDFFMLRRLGEGEDAGVFKAPAGTRFVVEHIQRAGSSTASGHYRYYDGAMRALGSEALTAEALDYDPRQRPWYRAAMAASGQITTEPYVFFSTGRAGVTVARRSTQPGAVVGVGIRLETLGTLLDRQRVTPGSELALVSADGRVVASAGDLPPPAAPHDVRGKVALPDMAAVSPVLALLKPAVTAGGDAASLDLVAGGRQWRSALRPFEREGTGRLYLVMAIPDDELMGAAYRLLGWLVVAVAVVVALAVPVVLLVARRLSRDLMRLADAAESVRHFDFTTPTAVDSGVLEVSRLSLALEMMKRTIQRFLDISQAVAGEKNFGRLLPLLLGETISAAEAQAGVLYLREDGTLRPAVGQLADGQPLAVAGEGLLLDNPGALLAEALAKGRAQAGELDAVERQRLGLPDGDTALGRQAVAIPLLNREQELVGAMVLLRAAPTDAARLRFVEALAGNSAVSLESRELIEAQKELFAAFIRLIAAAIDAKSPYTGGHCARVPELARMLAEAACAESSGPYADFSLDDEEWEAMHVAAWLHDCGKVTTPEYVVDKATKLETIYDRIHEVRMRFEVLKRDAEIAALRALLAGEPAAAANARLADEWRRLDDDFAFVAQCNEGGESMTAAQQERLQAIAGRLWLRTLDDRLGISHEERQRKAAVPPPTLPVAEPLLADKPEHRLAHRPGDTLPPGNRLGIRMPAPELVYNRGELHNLSVARGTLSAEERYKINDHIVQTLVMLDQLPFPRHLRAVPEIAGGHHEKMDGSGYPRGLTQAQMSPQARMIAIADIFEALTAVDRPYKPGKTLSEAIRIMAAMKRERHIDAELFDLFLRSGTYRRYAERFLRPEQIDAIDIAPYLG